MKNIDSKIHVRGESLYVDDIAEQIGTLHAAVFGSPKAHGKVKSIDVSKAEAMDGVVRVFTAKDIAGYGENQIGSIIQDEPLFADDEVHYMGMPVALVVAETEDKARRALAKIEMEIDELPVIVDPREAHQQNKLITPSRTFAQGDVDSCWSQCEHLIEGRADMGGQEHTYLETHGCYVYPKEDGNLKVHSGTQAPRYVQKGISRVLGLPMSRIEVDVMRLGGAFGGKEDQGTPWASMAALASYTLQKPVKLILHRLDDMRMSGKRHPYSFDFKIGLNKDLKIVGYQVTAFQNGGAAADVSPAVMERTLFHGSGSYYIPNASITVHSCRTNLPPNTAFRGFGAPQGIFAMEAAIAKAAYTIGVDPMEIQKANLLKDEDTFPFGQVAQRCNALKCWETAEKNFEVAKLKAEVDKFNRENSEVKKGLSMFPLCFGISFTKTSLNQGRSLVHVYVDGSATVTTGVIEMGQAVNTKILQVAAKTLSIDPKRLRVESTNTTRIANASPTAASSGADLNGNATLLACIKIKQRLEELAAKKLGADVSKVKLQDETIYVDDKKTDLTWEKLVLLADENRVALSEHAHYATPKIHFDKSKEKGHPFAYHVYGTAVTVVTLDCLRGTYDVDMVKIVHDFGNSMNLDIDVGQVEGALVQGIGLMSIEELLFNDDGRMVYDTLSSYKVPDIYFTPQELVVEALKTDPDPIAIMGSKAVGEPPLLYGIGTYYAVLKAMREFNPNFELQMWAPMTFQKCLLSLYEGYDKL